jgi:hypothetical protein
MTDPSRAVRRRLWLALVLVAAFWFMAFALWPSLYFLFGVKHYSSWFLDSFAILAANDALSLGRDIYTANALDPFLRPHVYSHWWLHLRDLGLTREQNFAFGATLIGLFFATAIATLRPRSLRELGWYLALFCSPGVLLATERANNDLVVFLLLAPLVPCLLSRSAFLRFAVGLTLVTVATGLKYYPAAAALLLLQSPTPREGRWRLVAAGTLFVALGFNLAPDLARFSELSPDPEGLLTFGAPRLLRAWGVPSSLVPAVALGIVGSGGAFIATLRIFSGWRVSAGATQAWLQFLLGAVLLTGCFVVSMNFAYRWVFALWMAPFLWRLVTDPAMPGATRWFGGVTAGLLLIALWADTIAVNVLRYIYLGAPPEAVARGQAVYLMGEQPLLWALFVCLSAFLARFAFDHVRSLLAPARPRAAEA